MIGRIRGTLVEKQAPTVLVEVGGIAYEIQVPLNSFHQLPQIASEVTLHIHFVVREDGQFLYGFLDLNQRAMFRALIKVNGVGPKLALAILSTMEPDIFARYVLHNDTAALVKIPGVGAKTASRLIVEMRDRLDEFENATMVRDYTVDAAVRDAVSALVALGYKPHEAKKAIEKHQEKQLASEELIRLALKEIK